MVPYECSKIKDDQRGCSRKSPIFFRGLKKLIDSADVSIYRNIMFKDICMQKTTRWWWRAMENGAGGGLP
jgi:hypothetical protein